MKLTYIYHSCFALETPAYSILFDYYKDTKGKQGYVHDILLQKPEPLYILSSHFHPDHFSREIFSWKEQKENIHYLLSKDILKHKKAMASEATFLTKGDIYEDDLIRIQAFGSTDVGVSFLLTCEYKHIFHAGDLNNWHWKDESTEQEVKEAEGNFLHEIKILKATCNNIDIALFPVDPRIGSDFARGAEQFIQQIHVKQFIPMHFWEKPELTLPFGTYAQEKGVSFNLLQQPGESLDI